MHKTIHLLLTGGTIDKTYNPLDGSLGFPHSNIAALLTQANCTVALQTDTLFLKDSLDTTDAERTQIVDACSQSPHTQLVITLGTDTMVQTAQAIAAQSLKKTVVLTGAMVPYAIKHSDALFNMGAAITAVQCLPPGVYLCMNGQVFAHDAVKKDTAIGQFVATS